MVRVRSLVWYDKEDEMIGEGESLKKEVCLLYSGTFNNDRGGSFF